MKISKHKTNKTYKMYESRIRSLEEEKSYILKELRTKFPLENNHMYTVDRDGQLTYVCKPRKMQFITMEADIPEKTNSKKRGFWASLFNWFK